MKQSWKQEPYGKKKIPAVTEALAGEVVLPVQSSNHFLEDLMMLTELLGE
jgi:hypothetical protein